MIEWHFSEDRLNAEERRSNDSKRGVPLNEEYYKKRPSIVDALSEPKNSEISKEVYHFIRDTSHYTINRGGGMSPDMAIAPDILKFNEVAKLKGIEIMPYENFCNMFVYKKTKHERRKD